uniref:G-protein coupled receptors family 1 profile domain-containing protein n=1 Tax=Urocitellus parryii TaxID=9999 RepID=A0A8D2I0B1_UROPR
MSWANDSSPKGFILLGFSDKPWLQMPLLVVLLISYTFTIFGNVSIMVVCILDPKLHTPMYFFLTNLSILDLCYTTSTVPHMLANICRNKKTISYGGCVAQLIIFLALGATECLLLAVMSFDRFVAICRPLHYVIIMNRWFCLRMAAFSWLTGFNNFLCEVLVMIKMSCADTTFNIAMLSIVGTFYSLVPLSLILISFGFIVATVLRIRSSEGNKKAFNTCGSHVIVVSLFYGPVIIMYVQPSVANSQDKNQLMSLFYSLVIPMLNSFIYTMRNKDMKGAMRRLLGSCHQRTEQT